MQTLLALVTKPQLWYYALSLLSIRINFYSLKWMLSSWKKRVEFTPKMHLVGTREPHSLLVVIVFTTCCFKLRWPLRYKSVMIMSLVQNAKKLKKNISHECKVNQSYTSSGKSVVRRLRIFFAGLQWNIWWWDIGGLKLRTDNLTFVGRGLEGMGDFRKNVSCSWLRGKKNLARKSLGKAFSPKPNHPYNPPPWSTP